MRENSSGEDHRMHEAVNGQINKSMYLTLTFLPSKA
jgi:hypothetical protein